MTPSLQGLSSYHGKSIPEMIAAAGIPFNRVLIQYIRTGKPTKGFRKLAGTEDLYTPCEHRAPPIGVIVGVRMDDPGTGEPTIAVAFSRSRELQDAVDIISSYEHKVVKTYDFDRTVGVKKALCKIIGRAELGTGDAFVPKAIERKFRKDFVPRALAYFGKDTPGLTESNFLFLGEPKKW